MQELKDQIVQQNQLKDELEQQVISLEEDNQEL